MFSSLIKSSDLIFFFLLSEFRPSVEAGGSNELQGQTDKSKSGIHRTHVKKEKMKIALRLVLEPYTVCRAVAVAGSARAAFPFLGRW